MAEVCFAAPGDPDTLTGGYLYNKRVQAELANSGWTVHAVRLPDAFPFPETSDLEEAARCLAVGRAEDLVVIDGLAFGAFTENVISRIHSRIVALVHHPLAEESGLDKELAARLCESERGALAHAAGVVVTSPHTRAALIDRYGVPAEKIAVAVPGVDRPNVSRAPAAAPNILSVGSLTARKGHDTLLHALGAIRDLDWFATIVGSDVRDPAVAEQLIALRADLGLADRVQFVGERQELGAFYAGATVFALATRHEGYGMVFSEAMVHGLPIVSCRVGAVPDTVPEGAGVLVPPDDPDVFAGALRRMLTDAPFRNRCTAASLAAGEELPTWKETARAFAGKLREVAAA
ncbi:MAG: glycosyltransferase family 4 protein [Hyphomicrobiaceae bacterium]